MTLNRKSLIKILTFVIIKGEHVTKLSLHIFHQMKHKWQSRIRANVPRGGPNHGSVCLSVLRQR